MAANKISYNNKTLIDLRSDTINSSVVLEGFTFHDFSGNIREGSIVNKDSINIEISTLNQITYSSGYYSAITAGIRAQDRNKIIPENIKSEITILGVTGSVIEKKSKTISVEPDPSEQTILPASPYNSFDTVEVEPAAFYATTALPLSKFDWLNGTTYNIPGYWLNNGERDVAYALVQTSFLNPRYGIRRSQNYYLTKKSRDVSIETTPPVGYLGDIYARFTIDILEDNTTVDFYTHGKGVQVNWDIESYGKDLTQLSESVNYVTHTYSQKGRYQINIEYDSGAEPLIPVDEVYFSIGYFDFQSSNTPITYTAKSIFGDTFNFESNLISDFVQCASPTVSVFPIDSLAGVITRASNINIISVALTDKCKDIYPYAFSYYNQFFREITIIAGEDLNIHPKAFYCDSNDYSSTRPVELAFDFSQKSSTYLAKWTVNNIDYTPFNDFVREYTAGTYYCGNFIYIKPEQQQQYREAFEAAGSPWSIIAPLLLKPPYGYARIDLPAAPITAAITATPSSSQQTINPASTDIGIESVIVNPIPSIIFGGNGSTAVTLPAEMTSITDILLDFDSTNLTMLRYSALVMDVSALSLGVNNVIIYPADYDVNTGIFRFSGYDPNFGGGTNVIASFQYDSTNNTIQFTACEMNGADISSYIPSVNWKINVVIYDDGT